MQYEHNNSLGYIVYNTQRNLYKFLNKALKPYNITPEQWNILNQLEQQALTNQKQLAIRANKDQAVVTRILDVLERKALISRERNSKDRREFFIHLTEQGISLREQIIPIELACGQVIKKAISDEEIAVFRQVMEKMNNNISGDI